MSATKKLILASVLSVLSAVVANVNAFHTFTPEHPRFLSWTAGFTVGCLVGATLFWLGYFKGRKIPRSKFTVAKHKTIGEDLSLRKAEP